MFHGKHPCACFLNSEKVQGVYTGLSDNYIKVGVATESDLANQLLPRAYSGCCQWSGYGCSRMMLLGML